MRPGIYEMVKAQTQPAFAAALEGRRMYIRRNKAGDGWTVAIKRVKKPIAGVPPRNVPCGDLAVNAHTKRTAAMGFHLTDDGLLAMWNIFMLALQAKERADAGKGVPQ